mmetsp:Transcript_42496/g.101118  ORF Transcript_42496/g.101118 Transcript_42496/m.101118 type:complete len:306 (-) Transcript_42496:416-1333(-)
MEASVAVRPTAAAERSQSFLPFSVSDASALTATGSKVCLPGCELLQNSPPFPASSGDVAIRAIWSPPNSTVSATCAMLYTMNENTVTNKAAWFLKSPVLVIRPGDMLVHEILEPLAFNLRSSSAAKKTLQSFESLYALSGSKAPPSTMSHPLPLASPSKFPRVALLPTLPPADDGSCTWEAVTTMRGSASDDCSTSGYSRFARRKCPRWLVPTVSSKPSAVRGAGGESDVLSDTPALSRRMSIIFPEALKSAANLRTDARFPRSHAAPEISPRLPPSGSSSAASLFTCSAALEPFSSVRQARTML